MRERSSPGLRKPDSIRSGSEANQPNKKDEKFDDIYSSVERLGGIGSSRSLINLSASRERQFELEKLQQSEVLSNVVQRFSNIKKLQSNQIPVVGRHNYF